MTWTGAGALFILVATYAGVAVGRIPGFRLDRAGIALLGGAAMIAIGAIGMEDAY
ncbi:MAG: anion transporter, partial [Mesorhizobium sp.]